MRKFKRLAAIMLMAVVMSLGAPQVFAGDMATGITGPTETPGVVGEIGMPGVNGEMGAPGLNGEMSTPGFNGWIGTGLAAIAALFG